MNLLLEERREAIKLLREILYCTADPTLVVPEELHESIKHGWEFIRVIDQRWIEAKEDMKNEQ